MSEQVKNPFANRDFSPAKNDDYFIEDIVGTARDVIGMFKEKVTPEDQKRKAGVWYQMIEDFLSNSSMTGEQLAAKYKNALPFRQRKTKDRFVKEHFIGKDRAYITSHLIDKVNDELAKGGMPKVTKESLLKDLGLSQTEIENVVRAKPTGRLTRMTKTSPKSGMKLPPVPKTLTKVPDPAFDRVKPLKPTMKAALKVKGITPSDNIEVLTNQFYNEIVRRDQPTNFSGQSELPEMSTFDFTNDYADEATDAVITAVITYIRALKEKKQAGEDLSKIQDVIVTGTERAEAKITQTAKDQAAQKVGSEILFGGKWLWILGGVVAFIIVLAVILRK